MGLSLLNAAEEYAASLARRRINCETIQLYGRELKKLIDYLGEEFDVTRIEPRRLKSYFISTRLLRFRLGLPFCADALGRSKRVCRAFVRWLAEEGHLPSLPSSALRIFKAGR